MFCKTILTLNKKRSTTGQKLYILNITLLYDPDPKYLNVKIYIKYFLSSSCLHQTLQILSLHNQQHTASL